MRALSSGVKAILAAGVLLVVSLVAGLSVATYLIIGFGQGIQLVNKGYSALAVADYQHAINYFDAALSKPLGKYHRSYVYLNRASACNYQRRFTESIQNNYQALRLNPTLAAVAYEGLAYAHKETQEIDKALDDLNHAIHHNANSEYAHHLRGMIFYERQNFDRAIDDFQEAKRCGPSRIDPVIMLGLSYLGNDDLDHALASFDAAIMMDPRSSQARLERARIYRRNGQHERAAADLAEAMRLRSESSRPNEAASRTDRDLHLLTMQVQSAYDTGDFDRAIQLSDSLLSEKLTPQQACAVLMNRGNAYSAKQDFKKALRDYTDAIQQDPKNAGAYVDRGRILGMEGRTAEAKADYEEALRLNPAQWQAYFNRGVDFQHNDELEQALIDYKKVTELNPSFVGAYINRAKILVQRHKPEEAIRECDLAVSFNPTLAHPYEARASVHLYRREYKDAFHDMEAATRLKSEHPESALNALAWLCATCPDPSVRDGEKAIAAATKACEITHWSQPYYLDTLAAAYAEAGKFDQAVKHQKKPWN